MSSEKKTNPTKDDQLGFYQSLVKKHGNDTMSVSSESTEHKRIRFDQISRIFSHEKTPITLHDVGMGKAHFVKYLRDHHRGSNIDYSGTDIVPEYVEYCRNEYPQNKFYLRDLATGSSDDSYDYVILSGVFHQMRNTNRRTWEEFAYNILENSFSMCRRGLAFNMVSPFADFYQENIYYADLMKLLHNIRDRMSRFFVVHHNYALFEFTVQVYREQTIKEAYPESEMANYFSTQVDR